MSRPHDPRTCTDAGRLLLEWARMTHEGHPDAASKLGQAKALALSLVTGHENDPEFKPSSPPSCEKP